ncbi:MAG: hypothetical protein JNM20_17285 [Rhizobiales bacterium]|nr:hypothetical protein [Hyphomicrobiales bacterium]
MSQSPKNSTRSRRFERRAERPVNTDSFVQEDPEFGLVVMNSPHDPKPSIRIARGRIVELDGRSEEQFDLIGKYIARMLLDINLPCDRLVAGPSGSAPASSSSSKW